MIACFQAGTPVHTNQGLMPIENIRVGTQILTQDGPGDAACYRPVWRTVAQLAQAVYAVQILHADVEVSTLFVTPDTPFQIEDTSSSAPRPVAANALQPGQTLFLTGGRKAQVKLSAPVLHTQHAQYGFAADANTGIRIVVDLSERQLQLADASIAQTLGWLESREPVQVPVCHFDVQAFPTCYVGDAGVWVSNSGCTPEISMRDAFDNALLEKNCFVGDTPIHVERKGHRHEDTVLCSIASVDVGDKVLSRSEITGEISFKRVISVLEQGFSSVATVSCDYSPEYFDAPILTTAEHPFWVVGKGWVVVRDLQSGDKLVTYNGKPATVRAVHLDVVRDEVYNIEVEDFHTYFVERVGFWVRDHP